MPSDIQTEEKSTLRKIRLSHVLAAGFFLQMVFVVTVLLVFSFFIADFMVTKERDRLSIQGAEITNLVGEARLNNLAHLLVVAAENETLLNAVSQNEVSEIDALLTNVFNTQIEGDLDLLLIIGEQSNLIWNIGGETLDLSPIFEIAEASTQNSKSWFMDAFESSQEEPPLVFTFHKKEIIDPKNGQVRGFIIGGIILSQNIDLLSEIRDRSDASHAELRWKDSTISTTRITNVTGNGPDLLAFQSSFIPSFFPKRPISAVLYFSEETTFSLKSAYYFSSAIAIAIILILTILTVIFVRKAFQNPVNKLSNYASEVKNRTTDAVAPQSDILEFNALSGTLEDVFHAFQKSDQRFQDFAGIT